MNCSLPGCQYIIAWIAGKREELGSDTCNSHEAYYSLVELVTQSAHRTLLTVM